MRQFNNTAGNEKRQNVINILYDLKAYDPDQVVIIATPYCEVRFQLKEVKIQEHKRGMIVFEIEKEKE